jgi:DNA-binding MarR family transcriptional regulator
MKLRVFVGAHFCWSFGQPLLRRLEDRGPIVRERDREDERRVNITLTRTGRKLKDSATDVPKQLRRLIHLPQQKTASLRQDLKLLLKALPV